MLEFWQHFYENTNVVAFDIFGIKVRYYALCYIVSLLLALFIAMKNAKDFSFSKKEIENYFIWIEIGIILGARLGFVFVYSDYRFYYLTHPWQIFNPFMGGEFVGIAGMSFHGAVFGAFVASYLYAKKHKKNLFTLLDLVAFSVPLAYIFGRIGNFLNHELFGRSTEVAWGVYVDGVLRHPSQLYEAFCEGLLVFLVILYFKKRQKFTGQLICIYGISYSIARFFCEFFREPDSNLGFITFYLSMGQILSIIMIFICSIVYFRRRNESI
ncbi:prolipoprotein diacylglyceryl transferase [Campylobacter canadensis]|uniref:Phosphatidylglycerol--prolipoprotein diacylglyceryl transferase n=1 Tax=Campylobacter canadensis TaxID=449520 RepID=A0ABS7WV98_9BACT|nr:prolipoprotein diacylglyceryl transferase [Campylobacter canadensis]MBZ7987890.1 prolipoprotein diacylglyceryl transferase [Campylobacter canadensis]MBZ7998366.1 prolipoprotein diacylglyceryl transferase [Campylobacter canadensis]